MRRFFVVWLGLVTVLAAGPALAQDGEPALDVTGRWVFETELYLDGTRFMRGDVVLDRSTEGEWVCRFTTSEYYKNDDEPFATSEQACDLNFPGGMVIMRSTVLGSTYLGSPSNSYLPDNFDLRVIDINTMKGRAHSWSDMGPVIFERVITTIS